MWSPRNHRGSCDAYPFLCCVHLRPSTRLWLGAVTLWLYELRWLKFSPDPDCLCGILFSGPLCSTSHAKLNWVPSLGDKHDILPWAMTMFIAISLDSHPQAFWAVLGAIVNSPVALVCLRFSTLSLQAPVELPSVRIDTFIATSADKGLPTWPASHPKHPGQFLQS